MTIVNSSPAVERERPSLRVRARRQTAIVSRWLHLYLSMVSFAVVLFFAVTGLTLNHTEWFQGSEHTTRYQGVMAQSLLHESGGAQPDKLGVVEFLRKAHKIQGAVSTSSCRTTRWRCRSRGRVIWRMDLFSVRADGTS